MTTTNYARFTINGTPATDPVTGNRGYDATAGSTLSITLELSPSPARSVRYSVYGGGDDDPLSSKDAPLITFIGSGTNEQTFSSVNDTAQIVMPGSGVHSYVIRCTVDAGDEYTFERMAVIPSATVPATRKIVPNETNQYEQRSWADTQAELVDVITGLGGGHPAVTLNATATTGGMSIAGQDISNQAATTAQNGYLTSADWNTFSGKITDPMTTRGDVIYRNPSNVTSRLASGSANQVIQSDGVDISWQSLTASDITDFDTEVSNNTTVATLDSLVDQDVTSGSNPTFDGANFSGIPDSALDETYFNSDGTVGLSADWDAGDYEIQSATSNASRHQTDNYVLRVTNGGSGDGYAEQDILTPTSDYRITGRLRSSGSSAPIVAQRGVQNIFIGSASTSWQEFDETFTATTISEIHFGTSSGAGSTWTEFDNIYIEAVSSPGIDIIADGDMEDRDTASWSVVGTGSPSLSKESNLYATLTLNNLGIVASGTDTNIGIALQTKGTGEVYIPNGTLVVGATAPTTNMARGDILVGGGSVVLPEITTPTADANYGKIYTKSDNKLYFQAGDGTEYEIATV